MQKKCKKLFSTTALAQLLSHRHVYCDDNHGCISHDGWDNENVPSPCGDGTCVHPPFLFRMTIRT